MNAGVANFIIKLVSNRSKDLFVSRLGTTLLLSRLGITGFFADIIGYGIRAVIGLFIDEGIYFVDVTMDAIKAGLSIKEFRKMALTEYAKARRKGLTDAEKAQIRKEYRDTLERFTRLRVHDGSNPKP